MIYVGHTKFRWRGMSKVLRAIERVRDRVGRVALVGEGWGEPEDWMEHREHKPRYYVDREYLKKVGAEALPAVPYQQVTETINKGVFNPVVYRPLFEHLGLVTCRTFETPAAGTIPLFLLERDYVAEIFGEGATAADARMRRTRTRRSSTCSRGPSTMPRSSWPYARIFAGSTVPKRGCASLWDLSRQ